MISAVDNNIIWGMSGVCLGQHLGHIVKNGQQSAVLHVSVMQFFKELYYTPEIAGVFVFLFRLIHRMNEQGISRRKRDISWQPCNSQGIVFLPLVVERLGAWHKYANTEVKKLGNSLARHTGEEETTTIKHLFQQLSLALVKGNAALLNNRNPDGAGEGDEGIGWR